MLHFVKTGLALDDPKYSFKEELAISKEMTQLLPDKIDHLHFQNKVL
jgi:hypothetical protein